MRPFFPFAAALAATFLFDSLATAAVVYNITDLGSLGGSFASAAKINESSQIVGSSDTDAGGAATPPHCRSAGVGRDLLTSAFPSYILT